MQNVYIIKTTWKSKLLLSNCSFDWTLKNEQELNMMKKASIILSLALAATLGLTACGGTSSSSSTASTSSSLSSSSSSTAKNEEPTKLVMSILTWGSAPADLLKVQDEINKIAKEKINAEVELQCIAFGSYNQQMTLMLSGGEQLDLMAALSTTFSSAYSNNQLNELDDLISTHGQGIIDAVGWDYLNSGKVNGKLYGITTNRDLAVGHGGFLMRKDILDKYNIDPSTLKTIDDIEKVFETVKQNEPNLTIVAPGSVGSSFWPYLNIFDNLGTGFGVLENYGQNNLKVVNEFETDYYKEYLKRMRSWYQKGYISKDVTTRTEASSSLVKAGTLFAYTANNKPGQEQENTNSCGTPMVMVQTLETSTATSIPQILQWTIPRNSKSPEKAMQFLNLMYTDPDIVNLLSYGIEGVHYVKTDDGFIDFPEGVTTENSGFNLNMNWMMGNEFIGHIWKGNSKTLWEDTKKFNETAIKSKAMGFVFDNANVQTEISAVQNVYDEYRLSLECGVVDPDKTLPQMLEKLKAAGLETIIAEKQKQLDAWAAQNNVK